MSRIGRVAEQSHRYCYRIEIEVVQLRDFRLSCENGLGNRGVKNFNIVGHSGVAMKPVLRQTSMYQDPRVRHGTFAGVKTIYIRDPTTSSWHENFRKSPSPTDVAVAESYGGGARKKPDANLCLPSPTNLSQL